MQTEEKAKTKGINHLLAYVTASQITIFMSLNTKAWKLKHALLQKEQPCRVKAL